MTIDTAKGRELLAREAIADYLAMTDAVLESHKLLGPSDADLLAGLSEHVVAALDAAERKLPEDGLEQALRDAAKDRAQMERETPGAYARPPRDQIEWKAADAIRSLRQRIAELEARDVRALSGEG